MIFVKRVISVITVLCILLTMSITIVGAQALLDTSITLTAPAVDVKVGDEISVPIIISDRNGLMGAQFKVRWNPKLLTMSDVYNEDDDVYEGYTDKPTLFNKVFSVNINDVKNGSITVGGIRSSSFSSSETNYCLGVLHFVVNEAAAGKKIEITFDESKTYAHNGNGDMNFANLNNASFEVKSGNTLDCTISLETPTSTVETGDKIDVPIIISDKNGLMGAQFKVQWNPELLTMSDVYNEDDDIYEGYTDKPTLFNKVFSVNINDVKNGSITVGGIRSSSFSSSETNYCLGVLHFVVNEAAEGKKVEITFDESKTYAHNGNSDADFTELNNASFEVLKRPPIYTVTFKNYDGSILDTVTVSEGSNAVYSGRTPTKESTAQYNYEFSGWDKSLENIMADTVITATYKNVNRSYNVQFIFEDTIISEQTVSYGDNATLLTAEEGYTYTFTVDGQPWNGTNITSNVTVTVNKTINIYTVTYVGDYNGTDNVEYNGSVVLPSEEGYTYNFTVDGQPWDGTNITSNVTVVVTKISNKIKLLSDTINNGLFTFKLSSPENIHGYLVLALYDFDGKLVEAELKEISEISVTISADKYKNAAIYKAFIIESTTNLKPISNVVSGKMN